MEENQNENCLYCGEEILEEFKKKSGWICEYVAFWRSDCGYLQLK